MAKDKRSYQLSFPIRARRGTVSSTLHARDWLPAGHRASSLSALWIRILLIIVRI